MSFIIMLISSLLYSFSMQGLRPIISLYADLEGASIVTIGLLVSAFGLLPMLLAIQVGKWLDKYGARTIASIGGSGMLVAVLIPLIYPSISSLFASQLCMGLSQVMMVVAYQKTVGQWAGNRDKNIMWLTIAISSGTFLGPLITGFTFEYFGFRPTLALSAICITAAIIVGLSVNKNIWKPGEGASKKKISLLSSLAFFKKKNLRKAVIASGLVLYSRDLFVVYFPVYGNSIDLAPSTIGAIISLMAAMAIVVRMLQYHLVLYFSRSKVLFTTIFISGFAFFSVPFFESPLYLFLLAGILGAGLGLGQPLSLVYSINFSPEHRLGEVLGLRITVNRGAQFTAPLLFSSIGGFAGLMPIFVASGAALLIGAFVTRIKEQSSEEPKS